MHKNETTTVFKSHHSKSIGNNLKFLKLKSLKHFFITKSEMNACNTAEISTYFFLLSMKKFCDKKKSFQKKEKRFCHHAQPTPSYDCNKCKRPNHFKQIHQRYK